ncbi:MAG: hypothetical protein AB1721_01490 [Patescibacteria group bacterium]
MRIASPSFLPTNGVGVGGAVGVGVRVGVGVAVGVGVRVGVGVAVGVGVSVGREIGRPPGNAGPGTRIIVAARMATTIMKKTTKPTQPELDWPAN